MLVSSLKANHKAIFYKELKSAAFEMRLSHAVPSSPFKYPTTVCTKTVFRKYISNHLCRLEFLLNGGNANDHLCKLFQDNFM